MERADPGDQTAHLRRRYDRERRARLEAEEIAERGIREARQREASFRALFAENPCPMWLYDAATLAFIEVNEAAVEHYGYAREEFLALTIEDIRPAEDVELLRAHVAAARPRLQNSGPWKHRRRDGGIIDVEIVSHELTFAERAAVLVLAQDVTQRLMLDAAKAEFLAAISHELRTPLTAIQGFARTLQSRGTSLSEALRHECVERIVSNAGKLERLVRDLLDVDRLGRGALELWRREVDVGALVWQVVEEFDLPRPIDVSAPSIVVSADRAMVERIVENLLSNAVTHTPADAHVWVSVRDHEGGALIRVEDDGPGIPEELRESIFQPFQQGQVRTHAPGVGIGLSLVARFAALHGGRAWAEERAGGGAALRVHLPQEPPAG